LNTKDEINLQKYNMRKKARLRRQDLANDVCLGTRLQSSLIANFKFTDGIKVAGYWPIKGEADVRPLLNRCYERSCVCLLPVVIGYNTELIFREWQPDDELNVSNFGVPEPDEDKPLGVPENVLVPLLAFDSLGNRLGYGGGYYDRTLLYLRTRAVNRKQKINVIGVAYGGQEVDCVPSGPYDQPLDLIITEDGARPFSSSFDINEAK
jgi:5-formyltetrahydrofolate cyclo-ligase